MNEPPLPCIGILRGSQTFRPWKGGGLFIMGLHYGFGVWGNHGSFSTPDFLKINGHVSCKLLGVYIGEYDRGY